MMGRFADLGGHLVIEVGSASPPLQMTVADIVDEINLFSVLL